MSKREGSAGFDVNTYDEWRIKENARDRWNSYSQEDYAKPSKKAGYVTADGKITPKGWEQLTEDVLRIESNAVRWLADTFEGARDEGHGSADELMGTLWFDPEDETQVELINLGEEDGFDFQDSSYGNTLPDVVYEGVSDFGGWLLDGSVRLFNIEGLDED